MTLLLVPQSYAAVSINGTGAIDCQSFQLPVPKVVSGLIDVAGEGKFDYNYGAGAPLLPAPFRLVMVVYAATAAALQTAFDGFFGIPPTGFYGEVNTFVAKVHGTATTKSAPCELTSFEFTQDVAWYSTTKNKIVGINAIFTPTVVFS